MTFEPPGAGEEQAALPVSGPPGAPPDPPHPLDAVVDRHRERLLSVPGVVGAARGQAPGGGDAVVLWATDPGAAAGLPEDLRDGVEGLPVVVHVVPGGFRAFDQGRPAGG